MYIRPLVSKLFYAVMLSPLQSKQSALVWPKSDVSRKSPRYGRVISAVDFINNVIPGITGRLSRWMFRNNHFGWAPVDMQLIAFGTAAAVFKLSWKSGAKVLRVYRKSVGQTAAGMLQMVEYYEKNYRTLLHWYGGPMDLVLPMEFLVLQGLPLVGPVAASLQPYVQTEKQDIFDDFSDTDFVKLMEANPFVRDQFIFFAEQTMCQWEERKICYDFVGRENLALVKQNGSYRLKIVDVGIFKFDRSEHNHPEKVTQIEQRIERLTYLYQLAKGVR